MHGGVWGGGGGGLGGWGGELGGVSIRANSEKDCQSLKLNDSVNTKSVILFLFINKISFKKNMENYMH